MKMPSDKESTSFKRTYTICDTCGKDCKWKSHLTMHQRVHTRQKPHKCDMCDKAFIRKNDLTIHQRVHTGQKPHKCDMCDKAFIRKNDLTSHQRIHTGEKPHKCDKCDLTFVFWRDLLKHCQHQHTKEVAGSEVKSTPPYAEKLSTRDIHGKCFTEDESSTEHQLQNSGGQHYTCEICTERFTDKDKLIQHFFNHRDENPYKFYKNAYECYLCVEYFALKEDMVEHNLRHHTDKANENSELSIEE